jgi:hypothetical protein
MAQAGVCLLQFTCLLSTLTKFFFNAQQLMVLGDTIYLDRWIFR